MDKKTKRFLLEKANGEECIITLWPDHKTQEMDKDGNLFFTAHQLQYGCAQDKSEILAILNHAGIEPTVRKSVYYLNRINQLWVRDRVVYDSKHLNLFQGTTQWWLCRHNVPQKRLDKLMCVLNEVNAIIAGVK